MRLTKLSKGLAIGTMVGTVLLSQPGWAQAPGAAPAAPAAGAAGAPPAGGGDNGGRRGGGGRFNPQEMRPRFMDRIKENLAPTTEEWQAIEPLLTAVMEKQRQLRSAQMGGMFGGRGGDRGGNQTPAEIQSLRDALDKKETPAPDIQAKLKSLRDLRKSQDAELQKAREELRKVLSVRQEAQLVLSGILD